MKNLLKKLLGWFNNQDPVTKLSATAAAVFSAWLLVSGYFPAYALFLLNIVVFTLVMISMGILCLHLLVGANKLMAPLYVFLYRLTGNEYYKNPLQIDVVPKEAEQDE